MRQMPSVEQVRHLLALAEGSGRVEFKRSCLWPQETDARKIQAVLMRLANANPETSGVVELGREDDGTRRGLVDKDLHPVSPQSLAAAEQTLVAVAGRMRPAMPLRWQPLSHPDGSTTVVIPVPGRDRGRWYQDEQGVTLTGSASHPVVAQPEMLQGWALEDDQRGRRRGVRPFRLQLAQLQRQAHDMAQLGEAITAYPHRFDVGAYRQLLPDVCDLLPPADPLVDRLHDLPKTATTINRLLDLGPGGALNAFAAHAPWGSPEQAWREALRAQARELDWLCQECEQRLGEAID